MIENMEGNKDESQKCINIAKRCIDAGHYEKAIKFLHKSERLYPSKSAKGNTRRRLIEDLFSSKLSGSVLNLNSLLVKR